MKPDTEAKHVAQQQVASAMLEHAPSEETNEAFSGNCLHQDGTSKFRIHFESFQVTTADKRTYSLGLAEVGPGDAASLMAACK